MTDYNFGVVNATQTEAPTHYQLVTSNSTNNFIYTEAAGVGGGYVDLGFHLDTAAKITFVNASTPGLATLDKTLATKMGWLPDGEGGYYPPNGDDGATLQPGDYVLALSDFSGAFRGQNSTLTFNLDTVTSGGGGGGGGGTAGSTVFDPTITSVNGIKSTDPIPVFKAGQTLSIAGTIANTGSSAGAPGTIDYVVYQANTDQAFASSTSTDNKQIAPQGTDSEQASVTLPSNLTPGATYYIKMSVGDEIVAFYFDAAAADPGQPNITLAGKDIETAGNNVVTKVETSTPVYFHVTASNNGLASGTIGPIELQISSDSSFRTNIVDDVTGNSTATVGPAKSAEVALSLTLPSGIGPGDYYYRFGKNGVYTDPIPFKVESQPISVAIDQNAHIQSGRVATIHGTSSGTTVGIEMFDGDPSDGGQDLGAAPVNGDGTWSFRSNFGIGDYTGLTAVASDASGDTSTAQAPFELVTGVRGQPYAAVEYDYMSDGGYGYTEYSEDGTPVVYAIDNGDNTHTTFAMADDQTLQSISNDVMTGGGERETFVFVLGFGQDEVTDFASAGRNHDTIDLTNTHFTTLQQALNHTTMSDAGAVLHLSQHDSITFDGLTKADLKAHPQVFAFA